MRINTYFGFFGQAVFSTIAGAIAAHTGCKLRLEQVSVRSSNTIRLRAQGLDSLVLPVHVEPVPVRFLLGASKADLAALDALCQGGRPLQWVLEQSLSSALEAFNFINQRRDRLSALRISKNVPGLLAHHLGAALRCTVAEGRFGGERAQGFSLFLLVSEQGRDLIEERSAQPHTQRALFSINQGAYLPPPQWEPPPPPLPLAPGPSQLHAWLQTLFALNDGSLPPKLFKRPAEQTCQIIPLADVQQELEKETTLRIVQLCLNGEARRELIVLLPPSAERSLLALSRSGQAGFLGDFFKIYFGEAAALWRRFADTPLRWHLRRLGNMPASALPELAGRLRGGGFFALQELCFDEGRLRWLLAISPPCWHFLLTFAWRAMGRTPPAQQETPQPEALLTAAGWGGPLLSCPVLVSLSDARTLQQMVRLAQGAGLDAEHMAAVAWGLASAERERWLAALPVMLRERTEARLTAQTGEEGLLHDVHVKRWQELLLGCNRAGRLPTGKPSCWLRVHAELVHACRREWIQRLLPLRHLVYGMERSSLTQLLFEMKNDVLADMLCGAEFPVIDQVRRAISPGFAVHLLENVALKRPRTTAFAVQKAQLAFYRACARGMSQGRLLVRPTPAQRLTELLRGLDAS